MIPYLFMEEQKKSLQGKKNRSSGMRFESKVREDLEKQGFFVSKWMNNIDLEKQKMTPSKRKYNPFMKALSIGTGFPDFIVFNSEGVFGVEVKGNGYLDQEEKQKCEFYLKNKIFFKILIARKSKDRGKIEYFDFNEKYKK